MEKEEPQHHYGRVRGVRMGVDGERGSKVKGVGVPFPIGKLGDAEVSAAGVIGALHGRLGGDLRPHGLHQAVQLGP